MPQPFPLLDPYTQNLCHAHQGLSGADSDADLCRYGPLADLNAVARAYGRKRSDPVGVRAGPARFGTAAAPEWVETKHLSTPALNRSMSR